MKLEFKSEVAVTKHPTSSLKKSGGIGGKNWRSRRVTGDEKGVRVEPDIEEDGEITGGGEDLEVIGETVTVD